jgi:hypothetical protein
MVLSRELDKQAKELLSEKVQGVNNVDQTTLCVAVHRISFVVMNGQM